MNEIEKMYKNAGVKFKYKYDCNIKDTLELEIYSLDNCTKGEVIVFCTDKEHYPYSRVRKVNKYYPPFTAEKQIELIKWLATRLNSDYMAYWHNGIKDAWIFRLHDFPELSAKKPSLYEGRNKDFAKALCSLINDLWHNLTEEERTQIREILE